MGYSNSIGAEIAVRPNVGLPRVVRWFLWASVGAFGLAVVLAWTGFRKGLPSDQWNPLAGAWLRI